MSTSQRISREELEDTIRSYQGGLTAEIESRKQQLIIGAGVGALLLLALVFFIGKRRGRRKSTFIEIRRF